MKPLHIAQMGLLALIWGSSYLFIKVAVEGITPLTLVEGRLLCGALVLLLTVRALGLRLPSHRSTWFHLSIMAVTGNIAPFLLIAWAEQHISSGLAAILNSTTAFFTLLIATLALRVERWTTRKLIGILIGFAGVAVLTGADLTDLGSASAQGAIALLLSSLLYGFAFAYARRFLRGSAQVLAASQLLVAAVLLAPVALVFGDVASSEITWLRLGSWLALGALSTGVAYLLYYRLIAAVGATTASYATYGIPIVGVAWGWLLLNEHVGVDTLLGVILILAGLAVASRTSRHSEDARLDDTPAPATAIAGE